MPHTARNSEMDAEIQTCIEACTRCHDVCATTTTHCLQKGGRHAEVEHLVLLLDCAEACQTSANFMLRGSHFHTSTCAVCAEICRACAESCDRIADDETMRRCAEECRRCAESCERMAVSGATH